MKDDRLRLPIEPGYAHALGEALFSFVICEWNAVYCAERIRPGSLRTFVGDELTAGAIAKKLVDLVRCMPKSTGREKLSLAARAFLSLVQTRNAILHGKPCTGQSGEARLASEKIHEIMRH